MQMKSIMFFALFVMLLNGFQYKQKSYYNENEREVEIQLSYIDSPLINIHWCGRNAEDDNTVLALTSKGSIYRSNDKGRTWSKLSEVFHRKALMELSDSEERVGIVNNIVASPVDSQLILFTGTEQISWISLDCGQTISVINSGKQLREFQFHPMQRDWILASSWNKCGSDDFNKPCTTYKELLISEDTGITWHSIAQYINQFSWGVKSESMSKYIPQERILASFEPSGKGHQSLSTWNMDANLYYSDDLFQTRTLSVASGARFLLTESYLFVAKVTSSMTQEVSLLVSSPVEMLGYQYETIDADQKLREHSYTILDTQENQVFMIVNHLKPSSPMGVIYISDSTGTRYSRSLENAVRLEGGAEFHRVLGLEGIYLANVYSQEQAKMYENQVFESQEQSGFMLNQNQNGFKDEDLKKFKQTRISFDKGAIWQSLKPPLKDSDNKPITCDPKLCALHLHLNQQFYQFAPIYSQNASIGIIVATGSVGKYLSYRPDQVNTYLSRDGGLTWVEMHKGSHIYEISDHGGLILMASDQQATTQLKYSWNEGLNWNIIQFSDDPVEVQNIITEPTNKATRFIAYGSTKVMSNGVELEQGILITVDLDDLHPRKCTGTDKPGDPDSDYELWTPSGIINPDCLFGKKVTYLRRKRESQCYNPETLDKIVSVESCPCSPEDYECDIGFIYHANIQQCVPINGTLNTNPPAECNNYYTISSGYRKIAGDMCMAGLQHQELRLPCPGSVNSYLDWLLLIMLVFAVYWAYQNQDYLKSLLSQFQSSSGSQQPQTVIQIILLKTTTSQPRN